MVEGPILAGVDGSDADTGTLRYAANVAGRTGAEVRVVHVATGYSSLMPVGGEFDLEEAAEAVLDRALEIARGLLPEGRFSGEVLHGQRQHALLEVAGGARLAVLGTQHRHRLERLVTGSTVAALASGAHCPVVVVPDTWNGDHHGVVGVGVKSLEGAQPLVAEAAAIAAAREARLAVVHAWHLPVAAYDALSLPGAIDTESWSADMRAALSGELADIVAGPGGPEVALEVVEGHPVNVLMDLEERIDLLVIARRTRFFPRGHLGGTARALMRESVCPVLVLPPSEGDPEPVL